MMTWKHIFLKDSDGECHAWNGENCDDMHFRAECRPIHNGYACYVSAGMSRGFHGDESLILGLDIPDTSDFLAINNHSSYWCSPFWGESLCDLPARVQQLLIYDGEK